MVKNVENEEKEDNVDADLVNFIYVTNVLFIRGTGFTSARNGKLVVVMFYRALIFIFRTFKLFLSNVIHFQGFSVHLCCKATISYPDSMTEA